MNFKILRFLAGICVLCLLGCTTPQSKPKQYLVSHILVPTQEAANVVLHKLDAGFAFERVAMEHSIDSGTKYIGGRIAHWTDANDWSANFAAEVKRLQVGQVSQKPINTEFGWHIVRVDAIR